MGEFLVKPVVTVQYARYVAESQFFVEFWLWDVGEFMTINRTQALAAIAKHEGARTFGHLQMLAILNVPRLLGGRPTRLRTGLQEIRGGG